MPSRRADGRNTGWPVVVCVPARDEAERLPRLLRSLNNQRRPTPFSLLRVVIVANNCRDETSAVVRRLIGADALQFLTIRIEDVQLVPVRAHVGTARCMALNAGADWLREDGADGILLTTDADAHLPIDWVSANAEALDDADIVGGRLVVDPDGPRSPNFAALGERIEQYWASVRAIEERIDPLPHDPSPRHGDHTGASLALRQSFYRAIGGLPALPHGEDNALVARVEEAGGRLRHCPGVSVLVSDRRSGRVQGGMAGEMIRRAEVVEGSAFYGLPAPAYWHRRIEERARLRESWGAGRDAAAEALTRSALSGADIDAMSLDECPNDIAFIARAQKALDRRRPAPPDVPLDEALVGFAALEGAAGIA